MTSQYGARTDITCNILSTLPSKLRWFHQKSATDTSEIHKSDTKYMLSPTKTTLSILSTDLDNMVGKYICEASVASYPDKKVAFTTNVQINNLRAPVITRSNEAVTLMIGQTLSETCTANGIPKPIITWQFKSKKTNVYAPITVSGAHILNPNIGYLEAGSYKCTATNAIGTQSSTIDVVVHGEPKITNVDSEYFGVTGDKVLKIPCDVTGVPEPTITWKHGGKVVTSDAKVTVDQNALYIKNPTEKDSNNFTCEAINKYQKATKMFTAHISDFIDSSHFTNSSNVYLKFGENKNITCLLPHSDPQSVRWYVNGEKTIVRGSSYSLQHANFSNDGNYTCRVNTDQGSESMNTVVDVGYEPIFIMPPSPIFIWNGDVREKLNCNVRAKPQENVEWFYRGKRLNNKMTELPISGWGEYTCKVTNVHGSVQQTFNVTNLGCVIDRTADILHNTPLLIGDAPSTWPKLAKDGYEITLTSSENITLACSTQDQPRNTFKTHPNAKTIRAVCYKEDQFKVEGVTYKFQDLQCNEHVKPIVVNTHKACLRGGEILEAGFKMNNGFLRVYDVCKVDQRIMFIKVLMSNANIGNIVEPSFYQNSVMKGHKRIGETKKCQYNQHRMVNPEDVAFGPAQTATLLEEYNIIPVLEPCENSTRISWRSVERAIQDMMYSIDTYTVWTGASHYDKNGKPRYLWKVVHFEVDNVFEIIIYVNDPDPVQTDILCPTTNLETLDIDTSDPYTYTCSKEEFMRAFNVPSSTFEA